MSGGQLSWGAIVRGEIIWGAIVLFPKNVYLKKILDLDHEFGLGYILLDLDWKSYGQKSYGFIITLITYFTGVGFENTWTTNLDYNYYILRDLDFKILRLRICISIVIYLAGFRLQSTCTTNLDFDY